MSGITARGKDADFLETTRIITNYIAQSTCLHIAFDFKPLLVGYSICVGVIDPKISCQVKGHLLFSEHHTHQKASINRPRGHDLQF